jgi:hypothetical protein
MLPNAPDFVSRPVTEGWSILGECIGDDALTEIHREPKERRNIDRQRIST